jgi:hypothetical protein
MTKLQRGNKTIDRNALSAFGLIGASANDRGRRLGTDRRHRQE